MIRRSKIHIIMLLVLSTFIVDKAKAQDASFSQNYASPLYLSPSFTGLTDGSRLSLHYRDQWPSIPGTYKTMSFAFDHYMADYNSGIGLQFYRDDAGSGLLVNQNVGIMYAYEIYINDNLMVRPGLNIKLAQIFIDPTKGNDINDLGVNSDGLALERDQLNKFDAAASVMVYSSLYWFGFTVDHLVNNDIGFTDITTNSDMKFNVFGGYKWIYREGRRRTPEQSVTFTANYRNQADFNQLDIGAYWQYNPIEVGLEYRGLPGKNQSGLLNQDAMIAMFGVHLGQMRIGYSYDFTISDLNNTGGAHEFSILYTIPARTRPKISRSAVPCSQPGNTWLGNSYKKQRSRSRSMF